MNQSVTLLYVDDEPLNVMLFERVFRRYFNIITANSGFTALDKLSAHPQISVVISDMKMPGMNGIEFIKCANEQFPRCTYFILTGYDITPEIAEAIDKKMIIKCFRKPFDEKEIINSVNQSLSA